MQQCNKWLHNVAIYGYMINNNGSVITNGYTMNVDNIVINGYTMNVGSTTIDVYVTNVSRPQ
jgi:hypothetical protein